MLLYILNWYPNIDVQVVDIAYSRLKISGNTGSEIQSKNALACIFGKGGISSAGP